LNNTLKRERKMKYKLFKTLRISIECRICCVILSTLIILNCCTSTSHVRSWTSKEDYERNFGKILVLGLVNRVSLRHDVEFALVDASKKFGLRAIDGMAVFPPALGKPFDDIERDRIHLQNIGFDAILTVAIIDVTAERYIRPENSYVPLVYYDRFGNYYYRTYATVYKKGYFTVESKYFLETNLYELKNGSLIWFGRSYAFDPYELEKFIPAYAKRLFKELLEKGIITK